MSQGHGGNSAAGSLIVQIHEELVYSGRRDDSDPGPLVVWAPQDTRQYNLGISDSVAGVTTVFIPAGPALHELATVRQRRLANSICSGVEFQLDPTRRPSAEHSASRKQ